MLVEMQSEWREYSEGDVIDVNEAIASQLHTSGLAKILQSAGEKSSALTSLQFKNAELGRVRTMITYHESELAKLKIKMAAIENAIEELNGNGENGTQKEVSKAPKDKMLKRPNISK